MDKVQKIFQPTGLLAKKLEGYEPRPQQEAMAEAVDKAINNNDIVLVEGVTGVGKSFAYLVPIILSGKRAIISTSNKSLQDQLSNKDLPILEEVLDREISWTVIKGRNNYFCYQYFEANKEELKKKLGNEAVKEIKEWADNSDDGDIEFCPIELTPDVKDLITCDKETEHEPKSKFALKCFAERARSAVNSSQIVLANHALTALDLVIKDLSENKASILPKDSSVYVIDEAHTFEEYASRAFSDELTVFSVRHFLEWSMVRRSITSGEFSFIVQQFNDIAGKYMPDDGKNGYFIPKKIKKVEGFGPLIEALDKVIKKIQGNPKIGKDEKSQVQKGRIIKEGKFLIERLNNLSEEDENYLKWIEARRSRRGNVTVYFKYTPIAIGEQIGKLLFQKNRAVICTSATLSTNGNFEYFRGRMGVPEKAKEMIIDSPFDFEKNTIAYISDGSLSQKEELEQLLSHSKGRAFVLFTSYRDMEYFYEVVDVPYPKFIQGGGKTRSQLLEDFKNTPNAVLFATRTFWEGVDIKGEKLSLVVIHKIPFNNPSDLLYQSKIERIDKKYGKQGSHWYRLTIPEACLALKQGFGRLIRSKTDMGAFALLDARVNTANYKNSIIRTLPSNTPRTQRIENIAKFFKKIAD